MSTQITSSPVPVTVTTVTNKGWACDCNSCPWYQVYCNGCNSDCQYCLCALSSCGGCAVRCPSREGTNDSLEDWWHDAGNTPGFDLPAGNNKIWGTIPRLIWMFDGGDRNLFPAQEWWATRIPASIDTHGNILQPAGTKTSNGNGRSDSREMWLGWGEDHLLERWWTHRYKWVTQAKPVYDAALAPNFSVYGNQPRMENLYNMRRSLVAANLLETSGIPAVVNIYWYRNEDLTRWVEWLNEYTPDAVAHNLTTYRRSETEWKTHLPGLKLLSLKAPQGIKWLFYGTRTKHVLRALSDLFGDYTLVSAAPVMMAKKGQILGADGKEHKGGARYYEASTLIAEQLESWLI